MRLLALPAELYPQIKGCAEYFLFNFSEGCVTASTGLPAELYPHILLCTPECFDSIPCFFKYVNYFFKNFYTTHAFRFAGERGTMRTTKTEGSERYETLAQRRSGGGRQRPCPGRCAH